MEVIEFTEAINSFSGGGGNHGQSFLVSETGYISCVAFMAAESALDLTGNITIYNGVEIPGGLAYTESAEVTWSSEGLYNFNLTTPFAVTTGQTYVVLSGIENIRGTTGDPYPNGNLANSFGVLGSWDSTFRITVTANGEACANLLPREEAVPVPALSSLGLSALILTLFGFGLLLIQRRKEVL